MTTKTIFDFDDYKALVRHWVEQQPRQGYGIYRKMALNLGVSTVLISQIFKGDRDLNPDQAFVLTKFMNLGALEEDYFLKLIQKARAATKDYADHLERQLDEVRRRSQQLKDRLNAKDVMSDEDKARFYSAWTYSAVRLAADVPSLGRADAIAEKLGLPQRDVQDIIEFLLSKGLVISENGRLKLGPQKTHLSSDSPLVTGRQISWRVKGFEQMPKKTSGDLYYTAPMTVSKKDLEEIRREIVSFIERVNKMIEPSPSEELACLNIDWFLL